MRSAIRLSVGTLGALLLLASLAVVIWLSFDIVPGTGEVPVQADPPPLPAFYWGEVSGGGSFVPAAGMPVKAMVGGRVCGEDYTVQDGPRVVYGVQVSSEDGCGATGGAVTFWIGSHVMVSVANWAGEGAVVEHPLGPTDTVYVDGNGLCAGNTPCVSRIQTGIDGVLLGGAVHVYQGTYTDTTMHRKVLIQSLSNLTVTNLSIQEGDFVAPAGTLRLSGDLTLGANGNFLHSTGIVAFVGSGLQLIDGDVGFYDVLVGGSARVGTTSDVTVGRKCTREQGATTDETKDVGSTAPIPFPLAGTTITPTVMGGLTRLRVRRVEVNHPQAPPGSPVETGRYWSIAPTGAGYSATLTLPHISQPDGQDRVCRWTGATWDCAAHSYDDVLWTITRRDIDAFSDWTTGEDVPTAVELASFTAVPGCNEVLVRWETAAEIDNVGFNLYRSLTTDGEYVKLNAKLIRSQFPGELRRAVYTWHDQGVNPRGPAYYRLEDVDTEGHSTWHGPIALDVTNPLGCRVYLPVALRARR